jgi:hypothetical protein
MRYEFVSPPHWANDRSSGFNLQCGCFLVSQPVPPLFPAANVRSTYFDPKYHGFQPRFGVAYTLTPKTVIRTGFGIFMDQNMQKGADQSIRGLWPWGASINQSGYNLGNPNLFFDHMPLGSSFYGPGAPIVSGFGADNVQPLTYSMEWNFGFQRAVTPNLTAEVDYIGSGSRHLEVFAYANTPTPDKMGPGPIAPRTPFYAQYPSLGQVSYTMNEGTAVTTACRQSWCAGFPRV